jgi:hypothetical protein
LFWEFRERGKDFKIPYYSSAAAVLAPNNGHLPLFPTYIEVLLLSYMPPIPTLASFTLASCIDEVDKLCFKCKMGVKPSVGKVV